jgi:hypothetical protein
MVLQVIRHQRNGSGAGAYIEVFQLDKQVGRSFVNDCETGDSSKFNMSFWRIGAVTSGNPARQSE